MNKGPKNSEIQLKNQSRDNQSKTRQIVVIFHPGKGIKEVRLESLDTVVGWYNQKMMYGEYRQRYQDPEFGSLTPKRKLLL